MIRSSWWWIAGLTFGFTSSAQTAHSSSSSDASAHMTAQPLSGPAARALPDAGLTLQPMAPPAAETIPEPRMELKVPSPATTTGVRATQNDTPPPTKPALKTGHHPYSPVPPKPDSKGQMPVPRQDPNAPTVPAQPKAPSNTNAPPADR